MENRFSRYQFPALAPASPDITPEVSEFDPGLSVEQSNEQAKAAGFSQGLLEGSVEGKAQGFAEGKQQGYDIGRAEGLAEVQALFQQASTPLTTVVEQLKTFYTHAESQQKEATFALVSRIASLVIQQEITARPELLLSLIADKLANEQLSHSDFVIRLAAADFAAIQQLAPEKISEWQLQPQDNLMRGECIIDTAQQQMDIGCQQRLENCLATLEQSWKTPGAER